MDPLTELIGESPAVAAVRATIRRLVERPSDRRIPPVLILGETGTGKGLLAQALHRVGPRKDGPFVDLNCAAIPEHLLESEMFGHEKGAFTDARQARQGLFQAAHRGMIFLDEIGLLSEALQGKLLKTIEERVVRRLGSTRSEPVDAWVVAATSVDLGAAVAARRFREDLFHRLAVITVRLPPLRDRGADVVLLAEHFLARACRDYGLPLHSLTPDARAALQSHRWPGNVRELANVMERVALLSDAPAIGADVLDLSARAQSPVAPTQGGPGTALEHDMAKVERQHLEAALKETHWNITRAAKKLGISRDTLRYRIEKHGLHSDDSARRVARPSRTAQAGSVGSGPPPGKVTAGEIRWTPRHVVVLGAEIGVSSPGESTGLVTRLVQVLREKADAFGGRVEASTATGITAAFGLEPVEDAPRRAANAAVAMVHALDRERQAGTPASVRIALHGGEFPVGRAGATIAMEPDARRNAATRLTTMLERAGVNTVLVDGAVAGALHRRFELVPAEGTDGAPSIYRLVGHERSGLEVGRRMTALVGRRQELDALEQRLTAAVGGHGQAVGIVGEAGIGKSRLLFELRRRLADQPVNVLEGHCSSYGAGTPYLPLLALVRQTFGVGDDDDPHVTVGRVTLGLGRLGLTSADALPCLFQLLGLPEEAAGLTSLSPEAIKARTFETLRQLWLRSSRERPLVLLIEDLHWIDRTSEEWVAALVERLAGAAVLFVATYRPGYRPAWLDRSYATQLALEPLGRDESLTMLASAGTGSTVPAALAASILDKAEGNPFFLEELSRALTAQPPASPTTGVVVPDTVQQVLRARIDRLADEPKRLLQTASVLGRRVSSSLLGALWGAAADAPLRELVRLEFLYDDGQAEEPVYAFKHVLTQEVAYETVPVAERESQHGAVGRALEALYADRLEEIVDRLAHHYARSAVPDRAVSYLIRLADKCAHGYAHAEAVTALQEAFQHAARLPAGERDRRHVDLVLHLVDSLNTLGRFAEIVALLFENSDRLERLDDPTLLGPYHFWLARTHTMLGDPDRGLAHARRALEEGGRAADEVTLGKACYALAYECFWSGRPAEGVAHGRDAIAHLERTAERWWLAHAHWVVSVNHGQLGEFDAALESGARARSIGEMLEDRRLQSLFVVTSGGFQALAGEWDAAIAACQQGLQYASDPVVTALARGFLGGAHLEKGDGAAAIPLLEASVAAYTAFGVRQMQGWFSTLLGEAWLLEGDAGRARTLVGDGLELAQLIRYRYGVGWGQRALGRIAIECGEIPDAGARLHEALDTFSSIGARYDVGRTYLSLARLAGLSGDGERVSRCLTEALARFEALRLPRYVVRTRQLAAELGAVL